MSEDSLQPHSAQTGPDLTIVLSEDGMTAIVETYTPPPSNAPALSLETLHEAMRRVGIISPQTPLLDKVLLRARLKKDITGMTVAEGRPPSDASDARIEFKGDMAHPVFHGDIFAHLIPPGKPSPGATVTGTPVPAASDRKPAEIQIDESSGALLDQGTMDIQAKAYGLVDYRQKKLLIKPLLRVAPNKLKITGTIYPQTFQGTPVSVDMIKRDLWAMGVHTLEEAPLKKALAKATKTGEPQEGVTVAKGTAPIHGEDGRFELAFIGSQDLLAADDSNVVDPRERSKFEPIKEGTPIGRLLPPKEGHFGRDVFGEDLVPRKGRPAEVFPGDNVDISADGVEFSAAISGMITWDGNRVSVLEMVHIKGDISYHSGNLRLDNGSVLIDGSIRDGFKVTAPGDICVGSAIESAFVNAGANVGVKGGIVMGGEGRVLARGDVSCNFAENAVIEAGGNVNVAHNLSTSLITAKGHVLCFKGKGIILGGLIETGKGVEANEIGSTLGVKTRIRLDVGIEIGGIEKLISERKALREQKSHLDGILGTEQPKALLERTPREQRGEMAELIKERIGIVDRMKEVENALEERRVALEQLSRLRVKVRRMAHPGTIISIANKKLVLYEPQEGPCQFFYDPDTSAIVME
ncbi:MAG: FapA family protein [Proteobacteria bacterium]|nr:FapA family protein [Pseudomonadota bacterium]